MSGAAQWQTPQYPNGTSPMDVAPVMPGSVGTAWARDPLDLARAAMGARTPDAQYPDGYLGDVNSRRERLFTEVGSGPRDQRGVHKGERLAPQDYALADETVNCRRLVKGYSDTHQRGGGKYRQLIAAAAQLVGRPDAADTLRALRDTVLANEKCGPMERQLADKLAA